MTRPYSPLKGFNNHETVPFDKKEDKSAKSKALDRAKEGKKLHVVHKRPRVLQFESHPNPETRKITHYEVPRIKKNK